MANSGTRKAPKKVLERRKKVEDLLLVEGLNQSQIAQRLGIDRHTVADDINILTADSEFWLQAQTRVAWVRHCKRMFVETMEEIEMLQKRAKGVRSDSVLVMLERAITDKRRFLIHMMTDMPLYRKAQNLAQFYEEHKPKNLVEQPTTLN